MEGNNSRGESNPLLPENQHDGTFPTGAPEQKTPRLTRESLRRSIDYIRNNPYLNRREDYLLQKEMVDLIDAIRMRGRCPCSCSCHDFRASHMKACCEHSGEAWRDGQFMSWEEEKARQQRIAGQ